MPSVKREPCVDCFETEGTEKLRYQLPGDTGYRFQVTGYREIQLRVTSCRLPVSGKYRLQVIGYRLQGNTLTSYQFPVSGYREIQLPVKGRLRVLRVISRLPFHPPRRTDCRFTIADCRFTSAVCRLPSAICRFARYAFFVMRFASIAKSRKFGRICE
jgi:hypothetical protein